MTARLCVLLGLLAFPAFAQDPEWMRNWEAAQRERPPELSSKSRIALANEPGEPLVVHGRVFQPDGVTPVAGATVFAYHTDVKGLYHEPGKSGWRLRGWARTDQTGAFEFSTIRPASYPSTRIPAHIHFTVEDGGLARQWAEDLRFEDDPFISSADRERSHKEGAYGNVRPIRREGTTSHVEFKIRAKAAKDF